MSICYLWAAPESTIENRPEAWAVHKDKWIFANSLSTTLRYLTQVLDREDRAVISIPANNMGLLTLRCLCNLNCDVELHIHKVYFSDGHSLPLDTDTMKKFADVLKEEGWRAYSDDELTTMITETTEVSF